MTNKQTHSKIKGGSNENLDFEMGPNTSAYLSCAANLNGEMFVFGGDGSYEKQVMHFSRNWH